MAHNFPLLHTTNFPELSLFRRGKVRDVYDLGDTLLIVASDRISAFDVIMNQAIPNKGAILTAISVFWFRFTQKIIPNHLITATVEEFPECVQPYREILHGRSMLVQKTEPLPVECVIRAYLAGSGWKDYRATQSVCGIALPPELKESSRFPEPIFTPATKAETGHDENITFDTMVKILGNDRAEQAKSASLALYQAASAYTANRGIIIADTKFEFGINSRGELMLIDEALTPDSSRFWLQNEWMPGKPQMNFDKQVLRDYLETLDWGKTPPPPELPDEIIRLTAGKYAEAQRLLLE